MFSASRKSLGNDKLIMVHSVKHFPKPYRNLLYLYFQKDVE